MPKDLDDYNDLVEEQLEELERQKEEKRRKRQKRRKEALERWKNTDEESCSCEQSGTSMFKSYPVSFLLKQDDFDMETDAEELWVCKQCGRIPSEEEIKQKGLSKFR